MPDKNQIVEIVIEDMGINGEGIGKVDGFPLFVKDAVIGDRVRALVLKNKKTYGYGRIVEIIEPGPDRVVSQCPAAGKCGGCQLQNYAYEAQLEAKSRKVRENLRRIGGFDEKLLDRIFEPIIGMENPYNYRNKAQYPVGYDREGNIVTGFYAVHSHRIIPCENCMINAKGCDEILNIVRNYMSAQRLTAYDETTGKGLVRHILIRNGHSTGEWMVCLIINSRKSASLGNVDKLVDELVKIKGMTSISCCFNTENNNVIMGDKYETLWGSPVIRDVLGGVEFEISPLSFYQVNPVQTEKLYGKALEYAFADSGSVTTGKKIIWDVYCGIGTISLFLAKGAPEAQVYGVEVIPQAINDAENNASGNGIENAKFYVGEAEKVLPELYAQTGQGADVIVVDPPRKGCDPKVIETMLKMKPGRIVYVSCDSATLSRDLKLLTEGTEVNGRKICYRLEKVCPCDMFPMTAHVETVVLMSKIAYLSAKSL